MVISSIAPSTRLPHTEIIRYHDDEEGEKVEFRLIYRGPLPSGKNDPRSKEKHLIRKQFHPQLRNLWRQDPGLAYQATHKYIRVDGKIILAPSDSDLGAKPWPEWIADDHQRLGGRFVPLVSEQGGFSCALDILLLRRDNPGRLIGRGGDLDNRLIVLFDGLRMPHSVPEMGGLPLAADEDPFYCLLEDDRLVSRVSVTTDRLLLPLAHDEKEDDVVLVTHVTVVNPAAIFAGNRLV